MFLSKKLFLIVYCTTFWDTFDANWNKNKIIVDIWQRKVKVNRKIKVSLFCKISTDL